MNKAVMKRVFYFIERFFALALILFAVYVFCYGVISLTIFKQHIFPINYILVLFITHLDVGFTDLSRNIVKKYNTVHFINF